MRQERQIIRAKVGLLELAKQLGKGQPSLQDGLQPRQLLSLQGAARQRRRARPAGDQPQEADPEEPHGAGDRAGRCGDGDRAARLGQVRVSEALKRRGLSISPAGLRCVSQRHDPSAMKHRLKALAATVAQQGIRLTEAQIAALEKATADQEAQGEFESECPGDCGAQDSFPAGTLKGVGRVYQQSVIDTPAKVALVPSRRWWNWMVA
jgi:hypothetical protein